MELQEFLIEEIQKRFSVNATIKALERKVELIAERTTFEKYKSKTLYNDGLEFELGGVKASLFNWLEKLTLEKVELRLAYFCISKLPKAKREKLEQIKSDYEQKKWLQCSNYKVPIWKELRYEMDIKSVLSGNINLSIEWY